MRFHASHSVERVAKRLKALKEEHGYTDEAATVQCQVLANAHSRRQMLLPLADLPRSHLWQVELMQAAEAHVYYNVAVRFVVKVQEVAKIPDRAREAEGSTFFLCSDGGTSLRASSGLQSKLSFLLSLS